MFFCATLYSALAKQTWDAQVAAAIVSSPTSAFVLEALRPFLQTLGDYGSPARELAVWMTLLISGFTQYFLVGLLLAKFLASEPPRK